MGAHASSGAERHAWGLQILVKWWAEYPEGLLESRVVRPLQAYLTTELVVTKKLTISVMNTIKACACTLLHACSVYA